MNRSEKRRVDNTNKQNSLPVYEVFPSGRKVKIHTRKVGFNPNHKTFVEMVKNELETFRVKSKVMKGFKDIKEISDIPQLKELINVEFDFECYDFGGYNRVYCYKGFDVSFIAKKEMCITKTITIRELITEYEIDYFSLSTTNKSSGLIDECWQYRPLVKESEKKY